MKLCLGTAQFGMPYGITNARGVLPEKEIIQILDFAEQNGVHALDTAPLYGESEQVLGRLLSQSHPFKIITKTPHFKTPSITQAQITELENSIQSSLARLHQKSIYGILVHNAADLLASGGEKIYGALISARDRGWVKKIGLSVYEADELETLIAQFDFDLVQVPINVLDQRLLQKGNLSKLQSKKNIEVYGRSLFLQGLLLSNHASLPDSVGRLKPYLEQFYQAAQKSGLNPLEGCLLFANQLLIDYGVIGTASLAEFKSILSAFSAIQSKSVNLDFKSLACSDSKLIDPRFWNQIPKPTAAGRIR